MFDIIRKEIDWGGRTLVLESGRLARQADGAVLVTYGETTVLCTAVAERKIRPGQDFFPLAVPYQEPLESEMLEFLDAVAEGRSPAVTGIDGLRALEVAIKAQESNPL